MHKITPETIVDYRLPHNKYPEKFTIKQLMGLLNLSFDEIMKQIYPKKIISKNKELKNETNH